MKHKRPCEKAVRTTISMPPGLWKKATAGQRVYAFPTFSDYIQALIRQAPEEAAHAR